MYDSAPTNEDCRTPENEVWEAINDALYDYFYGDSDGIRDASEAVFSAIERFLNPWEELMDAETRVRELQAQVSKLTAGRVRARSLDEAWDKGYDAGRGLLTAGLRAA